MLPKEEDQQRVKKLLTEAVTLLCRSSLTFEDEVNVEGLLGITLDKKDIFLVSIRETLQHHMKAAMAAAEEEEASESDTDVKSPSKKKRKRKKRKRSRSDSSDDSDASDGEDSPQKKTRDYDDSNEISRSQTSSSVPAANIKQEMSYNDDEDDCVMFEPSDNMKQEAPGDMQMPVFSASNIQWNPNDSNSGQGFDPTDAHFQQLANMNTSFQSPSQGDQSKDFRVACNQCEKTYTTRSNLQDHIKAAHLGVRFTCSACSYKTTRKQHLKTHVSKTHPELLVPCPECNKSFLSEADVNAHRIQNHMTKDFVLNSCFINENAMT